MDIFDEEVVAFWKALYEEGVVYLLVGGFATNLNGFSRTTADMDLWIKDDPENRKKLRTSFKNQHLGDLEFLEKGELVPGWTSVPLKSGFDIDLMTFIKGFAAADFDKCYHKADTVILFDIPIRFLHLHHLIEAKKASNRPKDQIDVLELERIRNLGK